MPEVAVATEEKQRLAALRPVTDVQVRGELGLVEPQELTVTDVAPAMRQEAERFVQMLLSVNLEDFRAQRERRAAVENLGDKETKELMLRSKMLLQPIKLLYDSAEGGKVTQSIIALREQVEKHNPHNWDLSPGFFGRLFGSVPIVGKKLREYLDEFTASQTVIDTIQKAAQNGQEEMRRDNEILAEDQLVLREIGLQLQHKFTIAKIIDQMLEEQLKSLDPNSKKTRFIQEELLFPLKKRMLSFEQRLATSQKGVIAFEVLVRNNQELVDAVDLALEVTLNELNIAVIVVVGLKRQANVLETVQGMKETTEEVSRQSAEQLKTQGVEIQKLTTAVTQEVEKMASNFTTVISAWEDIQRFRREALPVMSQAIQKMETVTNQADQVIRSIEESKDARSSIDAEFKKLA